MNIEEIRARAETYRHAEQCDAVYVEVYLSDVEQLLDALEAKERELADLNEANTVLHGAWETQWAELSAYRTAEEQGLLVRLQCKVGGDIYWINDEEKCVSVHKNGIKGIVVRKGEFAIEDTDGYIDIAGTKYCYLTREEAERKLKENT